MAHAAAIIQQGTAEQALRDLARRYQIEAGRTAIDDWADDVTRLSGDDVSLDDVEELIVGLRRSGAVDGAELTRLHSRYLDERDTA
ncbi:hypothetical protein [Brucella intermedia]|nr:hypothetical protein [Brucella intermedia]